MVESKLKVDFVNVEVAGPERLHRYPPPALIKSFVALDVAVNIKYMKHVFYLEDEGIGTAEGRATTACMARIRKVSMPVHHMIETLEVDRLVQMGIYSQNDERWPVSLFYAIMTLSIVDSVVGIQFNDGMPTWIIASWSQLLGPLCIILTVREFPSLSEPQS
ncbi:hypothetical protein DAEQUDRAFT_811892 [Daedalea quercina L-15889]|uniref:Uncharacterized protein n=1 Tax=Daedalea quercina L-15889 TaxID=1314783 RepID=A0A165Q087_9APHY|nr:hypothetical protein DAEQUDRAFT_811892 [Daedalea quercina L-15889]